MALSHEERAAYRDGYRFRYEYRKGDPVEVPYSLLKSDPDYWLAIAWIEGVEHAHEQIKHRDVVRAIEAAWCDALVPKKKCIGGRSAYARAYRLAWAVRQQLAAGGIR